MAGTTETNPTQDIPRSPSRRDFIMGVIAGGVAVSSAGYLFRAVTRSGQSPAVGAGKRLITLNVNGQQRRVDVVRQETFDSITDLGVVIKANKKGERGLTMEPLYQGAPILAVAAVDELTAAEAIERIQVDLEPLPFVIDPLHDGPHESRLFQGRSDPSV